MTQNRTIGLCLLCAAEGHTDPKPLDTGGDRKPPQGLCHKHYMRQTRAVLNDDEISAAQVQKGLEIDLQKRIKGFSAALVMVGNLQEYMKSDDVRMIRGVFRDYLNIAVADLSKEDEESTPQLTSSQQAEEPVSFVNSTIETLAVPSPAESYEATDADLPEFVHRAKRQKAGQR